MPADPHQAARIIEAQLQALWLDPDSARAIAPVMLWGPPGIGKSAIIRGLCERLGIGFLDVRLAQREPVDIRGLPVPREDAVHWLLSAEWPRVVGSRGIILFDELTACDRSMQVAAYEFILDRRLGNLYQVPPGWFIVAAGNRAQDRAAALAMSSALANRFLHLELAAELGSWLTWAESEGGIDPVVSGFLRFRPDLLFALGSDHERGWPSPRSWERVSRSLAIADTQDLDEACLRLVVQGLIGEGAAHEFAAFRALARELPDALAMLAGEVPVQVPERADERYALCAALAHQLWRHPERQAKLLDGFFTIALALPSDFAAMLLTDVLRGTGDEAAERQRRLLGHARFADWQRRHGTAFAAAPAPAGRRRKAR